MPRSQKNTPAESGHGAIYFGKITLINIMTSSKPKQQGDFQDDFDRLIRSFEAIAKIPSPTRRRFILNKIAAYYDIPKAECRALYKSWTIEQAIGGVA